MAFRLTNLTRQIEIGANCYLLEVSGRCLVLDCGAHPKQEGKEALPLLDSLRQLLKERPLEAIILTHAHQDHLGSIPVLMRHFPDTPVFTTEPTLQLADVMLHNSVNVMMKRKEQGQTDYPLFTHREVTACIKRFRPIPLNLRFSLEGERLRSGETSSVAIQFHDAGHILGSFAVSVESEGRRFLYSGDVNFQDQSLMRGAQFPEGKIDALLIESTRGNTPEDPSFTREQEELRFVTAIQEVFARGGSVLVPVFALGKTQEFLTILYKFRQKGLFPECPIYIGGLSTKLTEIHDRLASASCRQFPGLELLESVAPFTISGREVNQYPVRPGRIYALSSGMMTENTLSNVIAPQFLPNPAHAIFFVGYADPDSPGGKLRASKKGDSIMMSPTTEPEVIRCSVETFGFSAHGSRESITKFIQKAAPSKTVFVHGDPESVDWMKTVNQSEFPQGEFLQALPGIPLEL